ncbi:MAG: hypothetical protein MUF13_10475 [Akkermansiaceae bacterium]|nr:hypothetical protein [Akkermansiaceae bacterium]
MKSKTSVIISLCLVVVSGFVLFSKSLKNDRPPSIDVVSENGHAPNSERKREGHSTESAQERKARVAKEEVEREVKQKQLAFWSQNASAGLAQAKKNLVEDLELSAKESMAVEMIFARRDLELSEQLAKMLSSEAADDKEQFRKICDLLRNKGLREDLAGVLSPQKLARFDADEATREQETIEARAYRDMADLNAVVLLTDSQKQQALAALIRNAPEQMEHEADTRAFMTLNYGQMLADVDSSSIRGLANMVSAGLNDEMPVVEIDSSHYQQWAQENKTERIENELSALKDILDEKQLTRYREHLEAEPPW